MAFQFPLNSHNALSILKSHLQLFLVQCDTNPINQLSFFSSFFCFEKQRVGDTSLSFETQLKIISSNSPFSLGPKMVLGPGDSFRASRLIESWSRISRAWLYFDCSCNCLPCLGKSYSRSYPSRQEEMLDVLSFKVTHKCTGRLQYRLCKCQVESVGIVSWK